MNIVMHANATTEHAPIESTLTSAWRKALLVSWVVLLVVGSYGMWLWATQGHLATGYGSYSPWGLWIAIYFHGVGIAGGAFGLAALGYILEWPGLKKVETLRTAIVLAFAAVLPAFFGVWLDLGHPERAASIMLRPSFTSMMAFNAWMYNGFLIVAGAAFLVSYRRGSAWLKPLLCLAGLLSIMFPSQSGVFFGVVDAKPFWHSPLLPMLFLTSALTAGAATLMVVLGIARPADLRDAAPRLRAVILAGIAAYALFEFAEMSLQLWNPLAHAPEIGLILFGPYWWVFWIVHLSLGMVLSALLLLSRSPQLWWIGAALVAVCFLSARLNVLIPGQATADLLGLRDAFVHDRLSFTYHATAMEYWVGLFLVAMGMAVFWMGRRVDLFLAGKLGPRPPLDGDQPS